jgi:hypothetical protein
MSSAPQLTPNPGALDAAHGFFRTPEGKLARLVDGSESPYGAVMMQGNEQFWLYPIPELPIVDWNYAPAWSDEQSEGPPIRSSPIYADPFEAGYVTRATIAGLNFYIYEREPGTGTHNVTSGTGDFTDRAAPLFQAFVTAVIGGAIAQGIMGALAGQAGAIPELQPIGPEGIDATFPAPELPAPQLTPEMVDATFPAPELPGAQLSPNIPELPQITPEMIDSTLPGPQSLPGNGISSLLPDVGKAAQSIVKSMAQGAIKRMLTGSPEVRAPRPPGAGSAPTYNAPPDSMAGGPSDLPAGYRADYTPLTRQLALPALLALFATFYH